jgi:hypothetical protein
MVLTASSTELLQQIVDALHAEFAVKDMGALSFFLGIDVRHSPDGFYLSQGRYAEHILERAGMANFQAAATPIATNDKLDSDAPLYSTRRRTAASRALCST